MNLFDFALITLFNGTVCILLPRILTFNWSNLTNVLNSQEEKVTSQASRS